MDAVGYSLLAVLAVSLISFVGSLTLGLQFLRHHMVLFAFVAFAAGTLLGDALIHLIPEAVEIEEGFTPTLSIYIIGGFLSFFLLESLLRWGHAHGEDAHRHDEKEGKIAPFAWTNLAGDGVHNFIDGALIAATFLAAPDNPALGIGATIAVAAHEIPQELGDFAVLLRAGVKPLKALLYNFLSALLAVLGAVVVLFLPVDAGLIELYALPIIAGGFLYIAAADLVPELHHHSQPKYIAVVLTGMLAGVAVMASLLHLE